MKFVIKTLLITSIVLCSASPLLSQISGVGNTAYEKAIDLYEKGLPSDADRMFREALKEADANDMLQLSNVNFYRSMCAILMNEPNAEQMVNDFLIDYSYYPKKNEMIISLSNQFFDNRNYRKCVYWYERIDNSSLTRDEMLEHKFKLGYSYFQIRNLDKARPFFAEVKGATGTRYAVPAAYYYSHCCYITGLYDEALTGFRSIIKDDRFSELAAYYIMHIHFLKKDYANAIAYGTELLPRVTGKQEAEIARIVAESYLMTSQYDKALEYFAIYQKINRTTSRSDNYFLGIANLYAGKHDEALASFSKVTGGRDSIAQSALFYIGDTYVKQGKKKEAMDAFQRAVQNNVSATVTEDAAFNHAKLALELNRNTVPLNDFAKKYPNSRRNEELKNYMVTLYTGAGEYETALAMLNNIPSPTEKDLEDMQQVAFLYGKSLYDKGQHNEAQTAFASSKRYSKYSREIASLTNFWNAKNLYELKNYPAAAVEFEQFINGVGLYNSGLTRNSDEYKIAHYYAAYACFKQQQYDRSISWFRRYLSVAGSELAHINMVADAYNRMGDSYFIQRRYADAINNYNNAIERKTPQLDYAMYQLGLSYGFANRGAEKIITLTELERRLPNSPYASAALYEAGRTHVREGKFTEANTILQRLIGRYPNSLYYPKALNEVGLINMNIGEPKRALEYYRRVLENFPSGTEDYQDALQGLRSAYTELKDIDGYLTYMDKLGANVTTSTDDREEMMFASGQGFYTENNCARAIETFERLLQAYPGGIYAGRASFYLGDCYYKQEDYRRAATHFTYTMNQPQNSFTELAMLGNARSEFALKNYGQAIEAYEKLLSYSVVPAYLLEAKTGVMQAEFNLGRYRQAANAAQVVINAENKTPEIHREALLCQAKSYKALGLETEAMAVCSELSADKRTREGAEAAYMLIEMDFEKGNYDNMETLVFNFADSGTPQQYWVARGFMLLGDSYVKRDDNAQARATYQSLLEGYKNTSDGIIDMVRERMAKI